MCTHTYRRSQSTPRLNHVSSSWLGPPWSPDPPVVPPLSLRDTQRHPQHPGPFTPLSGSISTSSHTLGHTLAAVDAPQTHTGSWTYVLLQVLALSPPTSSSHLVFQTHTAATNSDCILLKTLPSPSALYPMKPPLLKSGHVTHRGWVLTPDPWIF